MQVQLSSVTVHDAEDLIAMNVRSRAYHAPWAAPFTDEAGFDRWFGGLMTGASRGYIARSCVDGGPVGVVTVSEIVWGCFRSGYLGYYGHAERAGRGLMTEAVSQVVRTMFSDMGLHRLEANIQPENVASIRLVSRLGFTREGVSSAYLHIAGQWRDHERWAIRSEGLLPASV